MDEVYQSRLRRLTIVVRTLKAERESHAYHRGFKHGKGGVLDRPPATQRLNGKWRAFVDDVFATSQVLERFTLEVWGYLPLVSVSEGTTRSESTGRPSPWDTMYMQTESGVWRDLMFCGDRA